MKEFLAWIWFLGMVAIWFPILAGILWKIYEDKDYIKHMMKEIFLKKQHR